ncbi:MAG: SLC13 family permease [Candidatus Omnitrophota bacterium]
MDLIFITIAIIFSVITAICPFKAWRIPVNMATGPVFAIFTLIALGVIDVDTLLLGIVGSGQLRPWEILVIFFSSAYVSISLEVTGILDFFAYKIVHRAHGSGVKLFFFFYLFSCFLTVFTSNDIVILILTPIIFYLGKHAELNIIPILYAEFFGANTLSMLLYIGNPTNIIVGNALGLGFLEYTKIMLLPTLTAASAGLALLYLFFKKTLTEKFKPHFGGGFSVRNWVDAVISCALLLAMLAMLAASQTLSIPIWVVTSVFAVIFIFEDLVFGMYYTIKHRSLPRSEIIKDEQEVFRLYGIPEQRHEFWIAVKRVPWKILPFTAVVFILVAGLNKYGAVDWLAGIVASASSSLAGSIAVNGILGFFLANIVNNQPMTILFSNILISESFKIGPLAYSGGSYAVIIASNLGANLTILGALAGLMWRKILRIKGIEISYFDFMKVGFAITPVVFILSLATLYFVLM